MTALPPAVPSKTPEDTNRPIRSRKGKKKKKISAEMINDDIGGEEEEEE